MNISAFLIGLSTSFFAIFALHILFWRKDNTRFQTMIGIIMGVCAVWNVKDLAMTFPSMYTEEVLQWIMIIDGWSALTYTVFIFEAVMPGWTTWHRILLHALPFTFFTAVYAIWPCEKTTFAYMLFLWFYAWSIVIIGYIKMRHYLSYVRKNYSNIDNIDVSWLRPVFFFAVIGQLAWLFTSLYSTVVTDIIYYVTNIILWLLVLHYSWNFHPITIEADNNKEDDINAEVLSSKTSSQPIPRGLLEQLMEQEELYMQKDLTLSELAQAMGTNRTYVSNYLNAVYHQTFYDYINQLRINRKSIPIITAHPEYTFEFVAAESGFASISTFRRAFIKLTGQTPSQYAAKCKERET